MGTVPVSAQNRAECPVARSGILDLRNADLNNEHFALAGEWKFYPDLLLGQKQLTSYPASTIKYPALWSKSAGPRNVSEGIA
ncbi:MAG TPA: hypothetical protein VK616_06995, partial [Flavitalea sp.]|nr:hypothetical protein [Flavitalea sp.]